MSRLYDNKPLLNLPIINIQQALDTEKIKSSGDGVIIEGVVKGRSKFSVTDQSSNKKRYYILHLKVLRAHRRKFNTNGQEVEPNFSETQKVSTGYLNSSYKVTAKGTSDRLSFDEVQSIISKDELTKHTKQYIPEGCANCVSLWLPEKDAEKIEIDNEDAVRIKTDGNSPFIYSLVKMDSQSQSVSNYAGGEQVGASWTDKIMGMKSNTDVPGETGPDDNDDEWDD